jgi:hypothetical protein
MIETEADVGIQPTRRVWRSAVKSKTIDRRRRFEDVTPVLTAREEVLLTATAKDPRHGSWAVELLARRDAVARWRGQAGSTIREVIQAINGLPA